MWFSFVILIIFIVVSISLVLSPKFKAKLMKNNLKTVERFQEENEETLRKLNKKSADIGKEGVSITAKAVKDGLKGSVYCKHCGASIDTDSKFCKNCGKEQ